MCWQSSLAYSLSSRSTTAPVACFPLRWRSMMWSDVRRSRQRRLSRLSDDVSSVVESRRDWWQFRRWMMPYHRVFRVPGIAATTDVPTLSDRGPAQQPGPFRLSYTNPLIRSGSHREEIHRHLQVPPLDRDPHPATRPRGPAPRAGVPVAAGDLGFRSDRAGPFENGALKLDLEDARRKVPIGLLGPALPAAGRGGTARRPSPARAAHAQRARPAHRSPYTRRPADGRAGPSRGSWNLDKTKRVRTLGWVAMMGSMARRPRPPVSAFGRPVGITSPAIRSSASG